MRILITFLAVALLACSTSAADRFTTRKNIHGGYDIYRNGHYDGRAMPNVHGGYRFYLKNGRPTQAATYKGLSIPSKVGGPTQYNFRSQSHGSYNFNPSKK